MHGRGEWLAAPLFFNVSRKNDALVPKYNIFKYVNRVSL